jgi:hypothetical protein
MNEGIALALIATVVSPMVLGWVTNRQRRMEKEQDWERQDEVAKRAVAATHQLLASSERVADGTAETNEKLEIIHVLVNSRMTAAMQSELNAIVGELAAKRENISLREAAGEQVTVQALAAIEATERRITELTTNLADRQEQALEAERVAE